MLSLYRKWGKIAGLGVVLAALLVGMAACGPAPTPEASPVPATATPMPEATPTPVSAATPTPAPAGGDITIAYPGWTEGAVLDSQIIDLHEVGLYDTFVADSLVCRDPKTLEFKPWLATDWELSKDGLTWTFYLRDDVKFHDGTPFNAEAVKVNIERIMAPETMSTEAVARIGPIKSVEVVDEYTVKITHERPYAIFLDAFSEFFVPIWSPTALEKYGLAGFAQHLVGSGPFIFKEYAPRDHWTVVRNPDYNWPPTCVEHTGPAYLNSITMKWIGEDAVLGGIVKSGEANIAQLPSAYVDEYVGDPNYQMVTGYQPGSPLGWVMNTAKPPLDDIRVRQAIFHAVDRESINEMLYKGRYQLSYGPATRGIMCYWEGAETMYPYDLEKANALLDEAGWKMNPATGIREKDGQPLVTEWFGMHHGEMGEALAAQFKEIGIDLKVEVAAGLVQIDKVTAGNYQLMYERQRGMEPVFLDLMWNSKNAGAGGWAWSNFKDTRMDELLDAANVEPDPEKRCAEYEEVQKIVMENALYLGMYSQPMFWGLDKSVKGFQLGYSAWVWYPYMLRIE